ncbi:uncharacterized protein [Littorina saxatilis]|uniref:Secreted protein n=1 Tax=Littorina saxatilis TaxID=31220 RepID=A0AAN9B827_9CAEN
MAFSYLCFVLVVAFAVTKAMPSWPDTDAEECTDAWLQFKYNYECRRIAPEPPASSELNPSTLVIPAQLIVTLFEEYCSVTFAGIQRCFRETVESHGCPNVTQLLDRAGATGGFCEGDQPATWLREGLLDRMVDLHMDCLRNSFDVFETCTRGTKSDLERDGYLDDRIDCLVREVKANVDCDKVAVFSVNLMHPDMNKQYGKAPSPQTLESLKDVEF